METTTNLLKYSIIFQTLSLVIQGGFVQVNQSYQYIPQPEDIMDQFIEDQEKNIEVFVINKYPLLEQYYFYMTYLSKNYKLIEIIEDHNKKICYLRLQRVIK